MTYFSRISGDEARLRTLASKQLHRYAKTTLPPRGIFHSRHLSRHLRAVKSAACEKIAVLFIAAISASSYFSARRERPFPRCRRRRNSITPRVVTSCDRPLEETRSQISRGGEKRLAPALGTSVTSEVGKKSMRRYDGYSNR